MAIIDRNCIFFEGPLKGTATGAAVGLAALALPGRMEPISMRISVTQGFDPAEVESISLTLEEAATPEPGESGWTPVSGASWSIPAARLVSGARLGPRFLPQGVSASFVRLKLALALKDGKTPGKGCIFAALMREDEQPWERALQKG